MSGNQSIVANHGLSNNFYVKCFSNTLFRLYFSEKAKGGEPLILTDKKYDMCLGYFRKMDDLIYVAGEVDNIFATVKDKKDLAPNNRDSYFIKEIQKLVNRDKTRFIMEPQFIQVEHVAKTNPIRFKTMVYLDGRQSKYVVIAEVRHRSFKFGSYNTREYANAACVIAKSIHDEIVKEHSDNDDSYIQEKFITEKQNNKQLKDLKEKDSTTPKDEELQNEEKNPRVVFDNEGKRLIGVLFDLNMNKYLVNLSAGGKYFCVGKYETKEDAVKHIKFFKELRGSIYTELGFGADDMSIKTKFAHYLDLYRQGNNNLERFQELLATLRAEPLSILEEPDTSALAFPRDPQLRFSVKRNRDVHAFDAVSFVSESTYEEIPGNSENKEKKRPRLFA